MWFWLQSSMAGVGAQAFTFQLSSRAAEKTGGNIEQYRLALEPGVHIPFTATARCQLEQLALTQTITNVDEALRNAQPPTAPRRTPLEEAHELLLHRQQQLVDVEEARVQDALVDDDEDEIELVGERPLGLVLALDLGSVLRGRALLQQYRADERVERVSREGAEASAPEDHAVLLEDCDVVEHIV